MKRYLFCFLLLSTMALGQTHKPFKVNVSVGWAQPSGQGLKAGVLVGIEPKYAVSQHLDLGLRLEEAFLVRGVSWAQDNSIKSGTVSGVGSAMLTATYLFGPFGESNTRPFLGVGTGLYSVASGGTVQISQNQTSTELPLTSYNSIGGLLRAGLKVGHFVASVEYNAIPQHVYQLGGSEYTAKTAYTGVRLGFDIGGDADGNNETSANDQPPAFFTS